jgi:hypothetical protein
MVGVQGKDSSSNNSFLEANQSSADGFVLPCEFEGLVFVRYLDHVIFNRAVALAMKPQIRETVGRLVYECDYYITVSWDRDAEPPTLKGGDPKASGLVILKAAIQELKRLEPLQKNCYCHLNCQTHTSNPEYALKTDERKTQQRRKEKCVTAH